MESGLFRRFPKISTGNGLLIFAISVTAWASTSIAIARNSEERPKRDSQHSLPIKKTITFSTPPSKGLLPMPVGQVEVASRSVESSRNPFQEPSSLMSGNLDVLNSAIQLNGIAKSGNSLVAMIKTSEGQQAYSVGDSLGNGFIVKSISSSDATVDISDGYKNYRLSFKVIKQ